MILSWVCISCFLYFHIWFNMLVNLVVTKPIKGARHVIGRYQRIFFLVVCLSEDMGMLQIGIRAFVLKLDLYGLNTSVDLTNLLLQCISLCRIWEKWWNSEWKFPNYRWNMHVNWKWDVELIVTRNISVMVS